MRLIDADEIHNLVRNSKKYMWSSPISTDRKVTVSTDDIQFGVDKIPTVDAVEVVRCGECKWTTKDIGKYPYCRMNRDINGDCRQVSEHGFCSYGERKDVTYTDVIDWSDYDKRR